MIRSRGNDQHRPLVQLPEDPAIKPPQRRRCTESPWLIAYYISVLIVLLAILGVLTPVNVTLTLHRDDIGGSLSKTASLLTDVDEMRPQMKLTLAKALVVANLAMDSVNMTRLQIALERFDSIVELVANSDIPAAVALVEQLIADSEPLMQELGDSATSARRIFDLFRGALREALEVAGNNNTSSKRAIAGKK